MLFSAASPEAVDLMEKLLTFDPRKRITAKEVRPFCLFRFLSWLMFKLRRADRIVPIRKELTPFSCSHRSPSTTHTSTHPLQQPIPPNSPCPPPNSFPALSRQRRLAHPSTRRGRGSSRGKVKRMKFRVRRRSQGSWTLGRRRTALEQQEGRGRKYGRSLLVDGACRDYCSICSLLLYSIFPLSSSSLVLVRRLRFLRRASSCHL